MNRIIKAGLIACTVGILLTGCDPTEDPTGNDNNTTDATIIIKCTPGALIEGSLYLAGSGSATIDWGTGSEKTTVTLKDLPLQNHYAMENDDWKIVRNPNSTQASSIITITGNITGIYTGAMKYISSIDVSKDPALVFMDCTGNMLSSLDVTKNPALIELICTNNQLNSLDVTKNTALWQLVCYNNKLSSLMLSNNTELAQLDFGANTVTSIDVSKNTKLTDLACYGNGLLVLDVSKNPLLLSLTCGSNKLSQLDVNSNTKLITLDCYFNPLTSLNLNNNPNIRWVRCYNDGMNVDALISLFQSLPNRTGTDVGDAEIKNNPGIGGTGYTAAKNAAIQKNWTITDN